MEFWLDERGNGLEANLDFVSELARSLPVREGSRLTCKMLHLEGELINVLSCGLSHRGKGQDNWTDVSIPDVKCTTEDELGFLISHHTNGLISLVFQSDGQVEIIAGNKALFVEFKLNEALAAILGLKADVIYSGNVIGCINLNALIDFITILSPLVSQSMIVNRSELRSLGSFCLKDKESDCLTSTQARAYCLTSLLSRVCFSIHSLLVPSVVLRARSFRLLASFHLIAPKK